MDRNTWPIFLRPLSIGALDESIPANIPHELADLTRLLLEELTQCPQAPFDLVRRRYKKVTDETREPVIVPDHPTILRHVIRPLREAKQCFVLGMAVACIAQAGLVGEMVALWRFHLLPPQLDGRPLDAILQRLLRGREFDELGQEERVQVLQDLDTLDQDLASAFDGLRLLRLRYVHFMVAPEADLEEDAQRALCFADLLVVKTLNASLDEDGALVLPPRVWEYIKDIVAREKSSAHAGREARNEYSPLVGRCDPCESGRGIGETGRAADRHTNGARSERL